MNTAFKWYIVNVYSGFEHKVSQMIKEQAVKDGLVDAFGEILVPSEDVVEIKKGNKVTTNKRFFPGYILVQMKLSDKAWHLVKSIPKVSSFLGTKNKPMPISKQEVERVMKQVQDSTESPRHAIRYEIGDVVKVIEGPFATFNGTIEEIEEEKERLKVAVSIFGRPTTLDLSFEQIEKAK